MLLRVITRRQRTFNLPEGDGIHLDALFTHQAQNMDIGAGLLGKAHHVELAELGYLAADNLRVVDPHRAAKFARQAEQVPGSQVGIGGVKRAWHNELRRYLCCACFFMITP